MGEKVGDVQEVCATRENHAFNRLPDTSGDRNGAKVWEGGRRTRFGNRNDLLFDYNREVGGGV